MKINLKKIKETKYKDFINVMLFFAGLPLLIWVISVLTNYFFLGRERTIKENIKIVKNLTENVAMVHREIFHKKQGRYNPRVVEFNYYSERLKDYITINVYLPPGYILNQHTKSYPIVYYLHGAFDGEKDHWFTVDRKESKSAHAELSATEMIMKNDIKEVIMVALDEPGGYFTTVKKGRDFEKAFLNEIMPYIESTFNASGERAITGLSSGGYYAIYFAVKYPKLFQHGGATSGSFFLGSKSRSILTIMKKYRKNLDKLKGLYFDMGNNDPGNSHSNLIIYNYLIKNKIRSRLDFVEGGHSFQVWRGHPKRFLKFCFNAKPVTAKDSKQIN